jgi:hypothetical protein
MQTLDKRIRIGTFVKIAGLDGWQVISEIRVNRKLFKLKGIMGEFQAGHIYQWSNRR